MTREEILAYLLENRGQQTCGRIYSKQLDFSTEDYLVTINSLAQKHKSSNLGFYLLTMGALILSGTIQAQTKAATKTEVIYKQPSENPRILQQKKDLKAKQDTVEKPVQFIGEVTLGIIEQGDIELEYIPEPDTINPNVIYSYVEKMPEFPQGIDSLHRFIRNNLKYPESEKGKGLNGVIYVQFVVDKVGKVKDPKILRSISGGEILDQAVLEVINKMPDWIPREQQGKKVPVYFNLPVRFKDE